MMTDIKEVDGQIDNTIILYESIFLVIDNRGVFT